MKLRHCLCPFFTIIGYIIILLGIICGCICGCALGFLGNEKCAPAEERLRTTALEERAEHSACVHSWLCVCVCVCVCVCLHGAP